MAGGVTRMFSSSATLAAWARLPLPFSYKREREGARVRFHGGQLGPPQKGYHTGSKSGPSFHPISQQRARAAALQPYLTQGTTLPFCNSKHRHTFPFAASPGAESPPVTTTAAAEGAASDATSARKGSGLGPQLPQCRDSSPGETYF